MRKKGHFKQQRKKYKISQKAKQFKKRQPMTIVCHASREGRAVLQQQTDEMWHAIRFASRFLTPFEQKYSFNELELLAVV